MCGLVDPAAIIRWQVESPRTGAFDALLHYSIPDRWAAIGLKSLRPTDFQVFRMTGSFDHFVE